MRIWLLVVACVSALAQPVRADDDDTMPAAISLRGLIVPSDQPESWPSGDWESVPAAQYAEFVDWLNRAGKAPAPDCVLKVAEYTGEYDGHDLIQGSLTIAVESTTNEAGLAPLGEFSPRIQNLRWHDGTPAVWGAASDQNSHVWIERENGTLAAEWSQKGARFFSDSEADDTAASSLARFDMALPSAVSSRLRLRIPATQHLHCTAGVISDIQDVPDAELKEWTIECGARGRMTFVILESALSAESAPWTADLTTLATAKSDGLHFDAELTIEASAEFPSELSLRIPRDLSITSVRTVSDATVEYLVSEDGPRNLLRMVVPNGVTKRHAFRIRGIMPLSLQRQMVFPFVAVSDSAAVTSSWTLKADRPLEVRDIAPQGLRQTGLAVSSQGESWQFVAIDNEPHLAFEVGPPETSFEQSTYCLVDLARPIPELSATTSLQCQRGTMFATEWVVPAEWSVSTIRSPDVVISSWTCVLDAETGKQKLRVEYREPVDAGHSITLEISAKCRTWHVDEPHPLPLISCLGGNSLATKLAVRCPSHLRWEHTSSQLAGPFPILETGAEFPQTMRDTLESESWHSLELWRLDGEDTSALCRLVSESYDDHPASMLELGQAPDSESVVSSDGTLRCELHAQTHVASTNRSHHRHQCRFELLAHQEHGFQFTLERPAEVLRVFIDGREVEPRLQQGEFQMPLAPGAREVQIDYLTPAAAGMITSDDIPLPQSNFVAEVIDWNFLLPADRRISASPADTVILQEPDRLNIAQRLLGPFARPASEAIFGLSQPETNVNLSRTGLEDASDTSQSGTEDSYSGASLVLITEGNLACMRLDLWDVQAVRSTTWTCMLGAFLVLLTLRRISPNGWKYFWLPCVVLAFASAWFGPAPLAMTAGGVLMGALLAAALPRRVIHPPRSTGQRREPSTDHRASLAASGTIGILLVVYMVISLNRGHAAQVEPSDSAPQTTQDSDAATAAVSRESTAPPSVAELEYDLLIPDESSGLAANVLLGSRLQRWYAAWQQAQQPMPDCLLNSARYEITFAPDSLPLVSAQFEIFLRASGDREVFLPLQNVVVVGATQARINNVPVPLIPDSTGHGFLISLPQNSSLSPTAGNSSTPESGNVAESGIFAESLPYQPSTIELSFRIRPSEAADQLQNLWSAGVPRVAQSEVVLSSEGADKYQIPGATQLREESGQFVISLPPGTQLTIGSRTETAQSPKQAINAISTIELGPEMSNVRVELDDDSTETVVLPIRLPPQSIVRNVRPAGQMEYFVERLSDVEIVWLVIPSDDRNGGPVSLDYSLVTRRSATGEWALPPLDYHPRIGRHRLEVTPRPGYQWASRPQSSDVIEVLGSDVVAERLIPVSTPETVVAFLANAEETYWSIDPVVPIRRGRLDERMEISSDSCRWTIDLAVESRGAPFFEYACIVDPNVEISSVSVQRDGAERVLRWNQSQDRLSIFVEGDQPGTHNVRINGGIRVSPEGGFELPRFDVADVDINARNLRLINRGQSALRWNGGAPNAGRLEPGEEMTLDGSGRLHATSLQFDPQDSVEQVGQSIWMMPSESDAWTIWQRLGFSNERGPLLTQTVRIPEAWTHVSVQAEGGRMSDGTDSQGRFVRIEVPSGEFVELNLLTRLSTDGEEIPIGRTERIDSTTLLLPKAIAINSSEWLTISFSNEHEAPEGFGNVQEWAAYRPQSVDAELPALPDPAVTSGIRVLHAESDIYAVDGDIWGETRYDVTAGIHGSLGLRQPAGAKIQAVFVDGVQAPWDDSSPGIPIPTDRPCVLIRVTWTAASKRNATGDPLTNLIPRIESDVDGSHFVCCWNRGDRALWLPRGARQMNNEQIWMERWYGLYEVAKLSGAGAINNELLQRRIGQCETALTPLVEHHADDADSDIAVDATHQTAELIARWESLKRSWTSSGEATIGLPQMFDQPIPPSWRAATGELDNCVVYRVTLSVAETGETPVPSEVNSWRYSAVGVALTLLLLVVGVWGLRRSTKLAWDDWLASHPRIAWILLGIAWWIWLSPSVLGFAILVLVALHVLCRRYSRWRLGARQPLLPSTIVR